jgi:D-serine deaminase-like pyridoxal phosphate-dependent protein
MSLMIHIKKPTLIIDETRVKRNIKRMVNRAKKSQIRFRPHFKTHQSALIGEWFRNLGVSAITVSSLDMAQYFSSHNWDDITVAVPVNIRQIDTINSLAKSLTLHLLVESTDTAQILKDTVKYPVKIWIEIDVDYGRSGIRWQNKEKIEELAQIIKKAEKLHLAGILTHAGQTYKVKSSKEIDQIHYDSIHQMNDVKQYLLSKGFRDIEVSVGDTPTCSIAKDFEGVDEIRPGNFVFYDLQQVQLGSCEENDLAIAVACPIIGKYPYRNELVIYGGAIHLSNELIKKIDGSRSYGSIAVPTNNGWTKTISNAYVSNLSQEHGIITADKDFIKETRIGDLIFVLPIHSCLTANLYQKYYSLKGQIIENIHSSEFQIDAIKF